MSVLISFNHSNEEGEKEVVSCDRFSLWLIFRSLLFCENNELVCKRFSTAKGTVVSVP